MIEVKSKYYILTRSRLCSCHIPEVLCHCEIVVLLLILALLVDASLSEVYNLLVHLQTIFRCLQMGIYNEIEKSDQYQIALDWSC